MVNISFEEALVQLIAKKKGLGEEEAKAFLTALKESPRHEKLQEFVGIIANSAEALSKLPPQTQESIAGFMSSMLIKGTTSSDWREKVSTVASILASSEIESLRKEIQSLKEDKDKAKYDALMQKIDELNKKYDDLLNAKLSTTQNEQPSIHEMVKAWLNEIKEGRELIRDVYKSVAEPEEPKKEEFDIEKAKETLAKLGYKIEGPITPQEYEQRLLKFQEQMQKQWEEEKKKIKEETEKKIKAELKRQEMLIQFGMTLADNLFQWLVPRGSGLEMIGKALKKTAAQERPS
jgi:outer membrane murein-binding lipoprotein Lpp